jgi:PTS system N-acetylgalactosamine-specific IIA component
VTLAGDVDAQDTPRAVVAGHGSFAAGLTSAVEQISGKGDALIAVSNSGLSTADIEVAIARAVDENGSGVVFTDLPAGSCTMAARRLQRARPGLEFVFRPAGESPLDAATAAAEKGRATLVVHP